MPIARVALPVAAATLFDYWVPEGLRVSRGSVVAVALGTRRLKGVVVEMAVESEVPADRLHAIGNVDASMLVADDVLELAEFVAAYYQEAPGMALALAVPPGNLRRTRRDAATEPARPTPADAASHAPLNAAQRAAVTAIHRACGDFAPLLLYGVTGSGKTDVYLAAAAEVIAHGGQVLLLVPEINLTPQLMQRVHTALPHVRIATLHSALAAGARRAEWQAAASGDAQLVLGTRLAVFAPMPRLGLVIVDEEHDTSYKQQDNVRYHARDAAVWRAQRRGVPIVLGSATPSLETWQHAQAGRYRRLDLPERADPRAALPAIRLAGNRPARALEGIGEALRDGIAQRLARGEQSLVFVNRRGFAPSLICASCRWEAQCPRCSARLTTHREPPSLRCHHCGHVEPVAAACPECGNVDLVPLGYGTQRLERALAQAFPRARIARVDRDSTRTQGAFAAVRDDVEANRLDILVGTQMLAKGHDFPRLTLVGVLGADNALYSADFRATERLCALLMQVAGRAGRADLPGEVIVQTDFAEHPVYGALVAHDYAQFAGALLREREAAGLPPFSHAAVLAAEAHQRSVTDAFLHDAHALGVALAANGHPDVEVLGVVPALLARRAGFERGQIVVQSTRRPALQRFLPAWRQAIAAASARRVRWSIDVDPAGFG